MGGRAMNLRPSKKTIRDFFVHFGWGILGGGLLSFLVLDFSLRGIDAIQPREKLDFFMESYALKENTLAEDMVARFENQGILQCNIYHVYPEEAAIGQRFQAQGLTSDFCILSESDVKGFRDMMGEFFRPLDEDSKKEMLQGTKKNYDTYCALNLEWGLQLYDSNDSTYNQQFDFSPLLSFSSPKPDKQESFYLFFLAQSVHFGKEDRLGYEACSYFLQLYEAKV